MNSEHEDLYAEYTDAVHELELSGGTALQEQRLKEADDAFLKYVNKGGQREPLHPITDFEYKPGFETMRSGESQGPIAHLREMLGIESASLELTAHDDQAIFDFKASHGLDTEDEFAYLLEHGHAPPQEVDRHLWSQILAAKDWHEPISYDSSEPLHVATDTRQPTPVTLRTPRSWWLALDDVELRTVANQHNLALLSMMAYEAPGDVEKDIQGFTNAFREDVRFHRHQGKGERRPWRPLVRGLDGGAGYTFEALEGLNGAQAYVLDCHEHTAVVFAGALAEEGDLESFLENLATDPASKLRDWEYDGTIGGRTHGLQVYGPFLEGFESLRDSLSGALQVEGHDADKPLFLTGHGIGGALATLAACYVRSMGSLCSRRVQLYTFGQPRVATKAFADYYWLNRVSFPDPTVVSLDGFQYYRIAHLYDLLTMFPSKPLADAIADPGSVTGGETIEVLQRFAGTQIAPPGQAGSNPKLTWRLAEAARATGLPSVLKRLDRALFHDDDFRHFGTAVIALQDQHGRPSIQEDDHPRAEIEDESIPKVQVLWKPAHDDEDDKRAWDHAVSVTEYEPMAAYLAHGMRAFSQAVGRAAAPDSIEPPLSGAPALPAVEGEQLVQDVHRMAPKLHTPIEQHVAMGPYVKLTVKEKLLDGSPVEPDGKHVYVTNGSEIIASAHSDGRKWSTELRWTSRMGSPSDCTIEVAPNQKYWVFIAPVRLTEVGEDRVVQDAANFWFAGNVQTAEEDVEVHASDVFELINAQHSEVYAPELKKLLDFRSDDEWSAKVRIASALASMRQGENPLDIDGWELDRMPEDFLEEYKQKEAEKRHSAEEACAQLASLFDSTDYRTIEASAIDDGDSQLLAVVAHLAANLNEVTATAPGRRLALDLLEDEERIPAKCIFVDRTEFPKLKSGLGALGVIKELAGAFLQKVVKAHGIAKEELQKGTDAARDVMLSARNRLRTYFETFSGIEFETAAEEGIYERVMAGEKRIYRGKAQKRAIGELLVVADDKTRLDARITALEQAREAELEAMPVSRIKSHLEKVTKHLELVGFLGAFHELYNTTVALQTMHERGGAANVFALGKSTVSLGAASTECFVVLRKRLGKEVGAKMLKLGGGLALVTGLTESMWAIYEGVKMVDKGQYKQAAAQSLTFVGGAGAALGAYLGLVKAGALASTGLAAALMPFLPWIAIGAVILLVAGAVLTVVWEDNAAEMFAKFCFLGDDYEPDADKEERRPFAWSPVRLSAPDLQQEVLALRGLQGAFRLDVSGDGPGKLFLGSGSPGDVVRVEFPEENWFDGYARVVDIELSTGLGDVPGRGKLHPDIVPKTKTVNGREMIDHIQLPLKPERKTEKNSRAKPLGEVFDPAKERRVRAQLRLLTGPDPQEDVVELPSADPELDHPNVVPGWLVVSAKSAKGALT